MRQIDGLARHVADGGWPGLYPELTG